MAREQVGGPVRTDWLSLCLLVSNFYKHTKPVQVMAGAFFGIFLSHTTSRFIVLAIGIYASYSYINIPSLYIYAYVLYVYAN